MILFIEIFATFRFLNLQGVQVIKWNEKESFKTFYFCW